MFLLTLRINRSKLPPMSAWTEIVQIQYFVGFTVCFVLFCFHTHVFGGVPIP